MTYQVDRLSENDVSRYAAALNEIREKFGNIKNGVVISFNGKMGKFTLSGEKAEMRIEGEGVATIYSDGRTEGNFESFTQWFVTAAYLWSSDESVKVIEDLARFSGGQVHEALDQVFGDFDSGK